MTALAVVLLAGGEGRRMGGGKPLRRYGETTLVAHALTLAHTYAEDVAVAVREAPQVAGEVVAPLLLDDPTIEGPLAGLSSALRFAGERGRTIVLTLPCDAPRLPRDLAARLVAGLDGHGAAVARSGGRLHPACALWRAGALDALPAYLASGRRSLQGFAAAVGMAVVDWPATHPDDPFANANTPDDLAALQPTRGGLAA